MFAVRLVNRRRNRLRPIAAFTYPCCQPATGLIRAYSDGGPVIATSATGGTKSTRKQLKTDESISEATPAKKPRKQRSDSGTSRGPKKNANPPKPRTPSTKPRKKRSDAGVLKGPLLKKAFEDALRGARASLPEGQAETDDGKRHRQYIA